MGFPGSCIFFVVSVLALQFAFEQGPTAPFFQDSRLNELGRLRRLAGRLMADSLRLALHLQWHTSVLKRWFSLLAVTIVSSLLCLAMVMIPVP